VAAIIVTRLIIGRAWLEEPRIQGPEHRGWPGTVIIAFIAVGVSILLLYQIILPGLSATATTVSQSNITVPEFTVFATKPQIVLNGTGIEVLRAHVDPKLAEMLGETNLLTLLMRYHGNLYTGYIELAESPSRFHSWSVCLAYQGYIVLSQRTILVKDMSIKVFEAQKDGQRYVLAYAIYQVRASFGTIVRPVYIKFSVLKQVSGEEDLLKQLGDVTEMLRAVAEKTGQPAIGLTSAIERITETTYIVLLVAILYLAASMLYKRRVWKGTRHIEEL
jgi:hypothetical protein